MRSARLFNKLFFSSFRIVATILTFLCTIPNTKAQEIQIPNDYFLFSRKADSLMLRKEYHAAIKNYQNAFVSFKGMATSDELFKVSQAWGFIGNKDSTTHYLARAVSTGYYDHLKILKEAAFKEIAASSAFQKIIEEAKSNKEELFPQLNLEWANMLEGVLIQDQRRTKMNFSDSADTKAILEIDSLNRIIVTNFIAEHGWLGPDIIGHKGAAALFIVIQHSPYPIRKKYYPSLKEAVEKGTATGESLALLEDRNLVHEKGMQLYGTQLDYDTLTKKYKPYPIIDEKNVNERRKNRGMVPLEAYLIRWGIVYTPIKE